MQINSSSNGVAPSQVINSQTINSQNTQPSSQVRAERAREQAVVNDNRPAQRLDIDEQAIAVIDEQRSQQAQQQVVALDINEQGGNTEVDQNSVQNLSAVSAYQGVENLQQRANIEKLFGVDLYA